MLKYYFKIIIRNLLKFFWVFPIDNHKIYFQSFGGKSMNCNPWYIFKYMYEKYPDFKYVWLLNKEPEEKLKGVTYVKKNTFKCVKEMLTSKVVITNNGFPAHYPFRIEQLLIETWHGGGAYKRVNGSAFLNKRDAINYAKSLDYLSELLSFYISSSRKFTEVMKDTVKIDFNKFLSIGMPRNDPFFDAVLIANNRLKICRRYVVDENDFIVLYAPTYRGSPLKATFNNTLDVLKIKQALTAKYNKKITILFRGHHELNNPSCQYFDNNVSDYPDMQELLCASDCLITDYSSSMWDYSFLYRPCFLFVPDFDDYLFNRGFYTDPYSWGFPICKTNEDLINSIENFNLYPFIANMHKHHDAFGSFEQGNATDKIVQLIVNSISN